ncbi:TlpA family protein disulfide reductase [Bacterioplanoides sp.]|uniref:TlpA family protein disulfide reductase n=1 Tax=Bacterioplanoides sp. TaxID=2066072 RepID=UPI003B00C395
MSNPTKKDDDSQKPSEADLSSQTNRRWRNHLFELLVVVLVFIGLSQWLNRHLLQDGTHIPNLTLPTLQGNHSSLNWPAAHDKTLIYFFAPWCSVCRLSMPGLNTLPDNPNIRIIAIALDYEQTADVSRFIDDIGFNQEVLLGNPDIRQRFNITGYPSYYVLDREGKVIHQDRGMSTPPGLWLRTQI